MNLSPQDVEQFVRAAQAFERAAASIERLDLASKNVNTLNFRDSKANALQLAFAGLLGINLMLTAVVVVVGIRMFDLDDKLSAIYMMAPHLKPDDKETAK